MSTAGDSFLPITSNPSPPHTHLPYLSPIVYWFGTTGEDDESFKQEDLDYSSRKTKNLMLYLYDFLT